MTEIRARTLSAAVVGIAALLLAGCTGGAGRPDSDRTESPSQPAPTSGAPSPSPSPKTVDIMFKFQPPETPCPPVSAQPTLADDEKHAYTQSYSFLNEVGAPGDRARHISVSCVYEPAAMADDEDVVIPEDHVRLVASLTIYTATDGRSFWDRYREVPLASRDPDDWSILDAQLEIGDRGVWREGCGPDLTSCAEDESPTVRTRAWETWAIGRIGNLVVDLDSRYIAQDLPADAAQTLANIYREFLLAIVDSWEHAG